MKWAAISFVLFPLAGIIAEPLFPTVDGTTWNYEMTQDQPSTDINLNEINQKQHYSLSYRIAGTETFENVDFTKLELVRDNVRASTDFVREEKDGLVCAARLDGSGKLLKFDPAQKLIANPLQAGSKWRFDGRIGDSKVLQTYMATGEEDVKVAAGHFHTWHIHCDQTAPSPATIDRWFAPGVGFVRILTKAKNASGDVLQQTLLELKEPPIVIARAQSAAADRSDQLTVDISSDAKGQPTSVFKTAAPAIYARWQGHGLPPEGKIRAAFIGENVTDVAADYEIDNVETVAASPNAHGVFTLIKPESGWTPGDYRVDYFVNDSAAGTVRFKIEK